MTDTDRLAALLHEDFMDAVPTHQRYPAPCSVCEGRAARLIAAGVTLQPTAPAEGLRIVPDGTREFVAFAVEYLRSVIPDHATVQAGDRLLAALAQSAAPAKERCLCGGPWPCPDIDAPNYRPEAYVPHGLAQPAAPANRATVDDWVGPETPRLRRIPDDPAIVPTFALDPDGPYVLGYSPLAQPAAPAEGLRAWCVCGRGVLPENWANHLKRKGTHAPLPLSPAPAEGLERICKCGPVCAACGGLRRETAPAECHKGCDMCRTLNEMDADDAPAECPGCTEQPHIPPCPFAREYNR